MGGGFMDVGADFNALERSKPRCVLINLKSPFDGGIIGDVPEIYASGLAYEKKNPGTAYLIMRAVFKDELGTLSQLIDDKNALPDFASAYGYSPLMVASILGHTEIVRILAAHPLVNLNRATWDGCTALHFASHMGRDECVRVLLNHRADFTLQITAEPLAGRAAHDVAEFDTTRAVFFENKNFVRHFGPDKRPKPKKETAIKHFGSGCGMIIG